MTGLPDMPPLRLHWWKAVPNFGDAISPVVLAHMSGRDVVHAGVNRADIWAIGSLLQVVKRTFSDPQDHKPMIWGTGLLHPVNGIAFLDNVDIALVRGPITAALLGIDAQQFGDPALLINAAWPHSKVSSGKIGIVPHHSLADDPELAAFVRRNPVYHVIDPRDPADAVCAAIAACDHVFASSLHGLIVADAYGVPNTWLDPVGQSRLKYLDYAASVGRWMPAPIALRDIADAVRPAPDAPLPYQAGIDACRRALNATFPAALRAGASV